MAESGVTTQDWSLLEAVIRRRPESEINRLAAAMKEAALAIHDGENAFFAADVMALLKRDREALDLLRNAVSLGYCAYPAMDRNPSFAALRTSPEFGEIRQAGMNCQARFVRFRQGAR
jgi:hypothetical protein